MNTLQGMNTLQPALMFGTLTSTDNAGEIATSTGLLQGQVFTPTTTQTDMKTPFSWIVHKTDYKKYSLNGSPNRQTLVILSRQQTLESDLMCKLRKRARKLGYSI